MASSSEIEKLERRYAENPDGRFFAPLADAYRKAGQVDRALELVRAGLAKHPDYLSAYIVLGRCQLDKGTDADAAATFQSVLGLDGENIIALKSLAEIAERAARVDEAREWLQKLLAVDSMNAEAEADLQRLGGALAAPAPAVEEAPAAIAPETSFADVAQEMAPAAEAVPAGEATQVVAAAHPPAPVEEPAAMTLSEEPAPVAEPAAVAEPEPQLEAAASAPATQHPAPDTPSVAELPTVPIEPLPVEPSGEMIAAAMQAQPVPVESKPDIHPLPSEARVSAEALEVLPFDDSLAWGTGERSSRAIRAEDIEAVTHDAEVKTPAIEFMTEMGLPAPAELVPEAPAPSAPAPAAPAPSLDEFTIEPPADQSLGGLEASPEPAHVELPANLSGAYSIVDEVAGAIVELPEPAEAPQPPVPSGLPLIMPEDVTPPEELARPSAKMVQSVSPPPREEPAAHPPMATETMGDLYLKQGFRNEAADVYRRLLAQRTGDAALAAKLRAAEGPAPDLRAEALGAESVGTWLKRVALARLSAAAPAPPPDTQHLTPDTQSPLESAFSAEPEPNGEPAHPAPDAFSLDQIFGAPGEAQPAASAPAAAAPVPPLGASFDEFFGAPAPAPGHTAPAPPEPAAAPKRPSQLGDEDLSAFSAWLQGLKK